MVEIGGMPILWHIMKIYGHYGFTEFVICLGYKGYVIKEFFANYFLHSSDVTLHLAENRVEVHRKAAEPWRVSNRRHAGLVGGCGPGTASALLRLVSRTRLVPARKP